MESLTTFATEHWDSIAFILTSIVAVASVIAKLTKTESDNKIVAVVSKVVNTLALNPKDKPK